MQFKKAGEMEGGRVGKQQRAKAKFAASDVDCSSGEEETKELGYVSGSSNWYGKLKGGMSSLKKLSLTSSKKKTPSSGGSSQATLARAISFSNISKSVDQGRPSSAAATNLPADFSPSISRSLNMGPNAGLGGKRRSKGGELAMEQAPAFSKSKIAIVKSNFVKEKSKEAAAGAVAGAEEAHRYERLATGSDSDDAGAATVRGASASVEYESSLANMMLMEQLESASRRESDEMSRAHKELAAHHQRKTAPSDRKILPSAAIKETTDKKSWLKSSTNGGDKAGNGWQLRKMTPSTPVASKKAGTAAAAAASGSNEKKVSLSSATEIANAGIKGKAHPNPDVKKNIKSMSGELFSLKAKKAASVDPVLPSRKSVSDIPARKSVCREPTSVAKKPDSSSSHLPSSKKLSSQGPFSDFAPRKPVASVASKKSARGDVSLGRKSIDMARDSVARRSVSRAPPTEHNNSRSLAANAAAAAMLMEEQEAAKAEAHADRDSTAPTTDGSSWMKENERALIEQSSKKSVQDLIQELERGVSQAPTPAKLRKAETSQAGTAADSQAVEEDVDKISVAALDASSVTSPQDMLRAELTESFEELHHKLNIKLDPKVVQDIRRTFNLGLVQAVANEEAAKRNPEPPDQPTTPPVKKPLPAASPRLLGVAAAYSNTIIEGLAGPDITTKSAPTEQQDDEEEAGAVSATDVEEDMGSSEAEEVRVLSSTSSNKMLTAQNFHKVAALLVEQQPQGAARRDDSRSASAPGQVEEAAEVARSSIESAALSSTSSNKMLTFNNFQKVAALLNDYNAELKLGLVPPSRTIGRLDSSSGASVSAVELEADDDTRLNAQSAATAASSDHSVTKEVVAAAGRPPKPAISHKEAGSSPTSAKSGASQYNNVGFSPKPSRLGQGGGFEELDAASSPSLDVQFSSQLSDPYYQKPGKAGAISQGSGLRRSKTRDASQKRKQLSRPEYIDESDGSSPMWMDSARSRSSGSSSSRSRQEMGGESEEGEPWPRSGPVIPPSLLRHVYEETDAASFSGLLLAREQGGGSRSGSGRLYFSGPLISETIKKSKLVKSGPGSTVSGDFMDRSLSRSASGKALEADNLAPMLQSYDEHQHEYLIQDHQQLYEYLDQYSEQHTFLDDYIADQLQELSLRHDLHDLLSDQLEQAKCQAHAEAGLAAAHSASASASEQETAPVHPQESDAREKEARSIQRSSSSKSLAASVADMQDNGSGSDANQESSRRSTVSSRAKSKLSQSLGDDSDRDPVGNKPQQQQQRFRLGMDSAISTPTARSSPGMSRGRRGAGEDTNADFSKPRSRSRSRQREPVSPHLAPLSPSPPPNLLSSARSSAASPGSGYNRTSFPSLYLMQVSNSSTAKTFSPHTPSRQFRLPSRSLLNQNISTIGTKLEEQVKPANAKPSAAAAWRSAKTPFQIKSPTAAQARAQADLFNSSIQSEPGTNATSLLLSLESRGDVARPLYSSFNPDQRASRPTREPLLQPKPQEQMEQVHAYQASASASDDQSGEEWEHEREGGRGERGQGEEEGELLETMTVDSSMSVGAFRRAALQRFSSTYGMDGDMAAEGEGEGEEGWEQQSSSNWDTRLVLYNQPAEQTDESLAQKRNQLQQLCASVEVSQRSGFHSAIVDMILDKDDMNDLLDLEEFLNCYLCLRPPYQDLVKSFFGQLCQTALVC